VGISSQLLGQEKRPEEREMEERGTPALIVGRKDMETGGIRPELKGTSILQTCFKEPIKIW
jgi:hypothetical protein